MGTRFEVLLELRTRPDNQTVSFKQDGKRFPNATTVKLCVDQEYALCVRIRPAYKLLEKDDEYKSREWHMEDDGLTFHDLPASSSNSKRDPDMAGYTAVWSTEGFTPNKDGHRHDLRIHFKLEDDLEINTSVQVKFYGLNKRTASRWGQPMHVLDLSCDSLPGQSRVNVRRGSIL